MTSKINSKGQTYYLHSRTGIHGGILFFFSKDKEGEVEIPKGFEIIENQKTHLPLVKRS